MDNVTAIIDSLGALQAQRKALETEEKLLKEQIIAITGGNGKAAGQAFEVVVTTAPSIRQRLREDCPASSAAHTVTKDVTQGKVKRVGGHPPSQPAPSRNGRGFWGRVTPTWRSTWTSTQ